MKTQLVSIGKGLTGRTRGSSRWRLALACLVLLALVMVPSRAQGGAAEANTALQAPVGTPAELASSLSASDTSDALTFVDALFDDTDLDGAISVAVSPDGNHVYVASHLANALLAFRRDQSTGALVLVDVEQDGVNGVDGLSSVMAVAISPDGDHVYTASAGDNAVAVFGRDQSTGTLSYVEMEKDGVGGVDGLLWAWSVTVSPNGLHVYVAGYLDSAVAWFSRDETDGTLTYGGMIKDDFGGVDGLGGASSVAISPNGLHVYVTGSDDDAVARFLRSSSTGTLTYLDTVWDDTGGVDGLDGAWSVALSPDGHYVYVTGKYEDALAAFSRNLYGELTYIETEWDGAGGVDGLDAPETVAVSPDGDHVYVAGAGDNALAAFNRDVSSGALTFVGMKQDGVGGADGLEGACGVAVSPDGDHVYVASYDDDAVTVFARGEIGDDTTYAGMVQDGVGGVDGLEGATSVAFSPNGDSVYVAGYLDNAVAWFSRDATTGALSFIEVEKDGVDGVDGLFHPSSVAVSPDGRYVYVTGSGDGTVVIFSSSLYYIGMVQDGVNGMDGLASAHGVAVSPDGAHIYVASPGDNAVSVFRWYKYTNTLTYLGMVKDGVGGVDGLLWAWSVTVSPDGRHVYVAGYLDNAVAVFSRDKTTGALTYVGVVQDGVGGVDGLAAASSVAVSPDGAHVYVTGSADDAVAVFSRSATTGVLSYVGMEKDGVGGVDGLYVANSVAVSPDGHHVYVAGDGDDAMAVFRRDTTTGALTYVEVKKDGVGGVDGLDGARSVTVSPDGHHVYVTGYWDNAVAIFGRQKRADSLTYAKTSWRADGLGGAFSVAVSPDGDHLYVASYDDDAVTVFERSLLTGGLTYVETEWDGAGGVDGLNGACSVAVSPDGNHVYVTGYYDDALVVFSRNGTTGALSYVETEWDGVGGVDGLYGPRSVAVSPNGDYVYVAGTGDDAVVTFERNETSGALSYVGMQQDDSRGGSIGALDGAYGVAVSPDSSHVYVTSLYDDAVVVFRPDVPSGGLAYVGSVQDGVGGVDGLEGARSVSVSPDGDHVYVAGYYEDAVAAFSRNQTTGALTYVGVQKDGVGGVDGLAGAASVAFSPDGGSVYVAGRFDNAVVAFNRNGTTGALTYVGMKQDGVGGVDGLAEVLSVAVSPDGRHVYTAAYDDDAVAVFRRQFSVFLPLTLRNH